MNIFSSHIVLMSSPPSGSAGDIVFLLASRSLLNAYRLLLPSAIRLLSVCLHYVAYCG